MSFPCDDLGQPYEGADTCLEIIDRVQSSHIQAFEAAREQEAEAARRLQAEQQKARGDIPGKRLCLAPTCRTEFLGTGDAPACTSCGGRRSVAMQARFNYRDIVAIFAAEQGEVREEDPVVQQRPSKAQPGANDAKRRIEAPTITED